MLKIVNHNLFYNNIRLWLHFVVNYNYISHTWTVKTHQYFNAYQTGGLLWYSLFKYSRIGCKWSCATLQPSREISGKRNYTPTNPIKGKCQFWTFLGCENFLDSWCLCSHVCRTINIFCYVSTCCTCICPKQIFTVV